MAGELRGGGEAVPGVLRDGPVAAVRDPPRDAATQLRDGGRRVVQRLRDDRGDRPLEGDVAGEHLVERDAEVVDVRTGREFGPGDLLRGHVRRRADGGSVLGEAGEVPGLGRPDEAEVQQHRRPVAAEHDVRGLDVPVDQAFGVGRGEGVREVGRDEGGVSRVKGAVLGEGRGERPPVDEFHRHGRPAAGLEDLVDAADAGVRQAGGGPRLADEPPHQFPVPRVVQGRDLHRDRAVQHRVGRPVHDPHRPAAEDPLEAVLADQPTGEVGRGGPDRGGSGRRVGGAGHRQANAFGGETSTARTTSETKHGPPGNPRAGRAGGIDRPAAAA